MVLASVASSWVRFRACPDFSLHSQLCDFGSARSATTEAGLGMSNRQASMCTMSGGGPAGSDQGRVVGCSLSGAAGD